MMITPRTPLFGFLCVIQSLVSFAPCEVYVVKICKSCVVTSGVFVCESDSGLFTLVCGI
jgi:hypothetical protein